MSTDHPTMVDVARDADVSLKTVSRVVNGVTTVDPDLAARVMTSVERLGFRRNTLAASLRAGRSDVIGLITADLSNAFYTAIASAVATVAHEHGHQVIMASTDEDPATERRLALDLMQRRVGGMIIVPSGSDQSAVFADAHLGVPVVFLDRPPHGLDADSVLLDDDAGSYAVVSGLVQRGHRRIALLLDSLDIATMRMRLAGARRGLADAGIEPVVVQTGLHTPEAARAAVAELLANSTPIDAVFCANNRVTIGAVEAVAGSASGRAPAIGGFDDFELAHLMPVPLLLAAYDTASLGRVAAELLFRRMDGDTTAPVRHLVPTHLVQYP